MAFHVPENQSVSWTVYLQSVASEVRATHDFITLHMSKISRAFDHGEPIWMIVAELNLINDATKTRLDVNRSPKSLAVRFVRF
jgi:hypothetical protein